MQDLSGRLLSISKNVTLIQTSGTDFIQQIISFNNNSFKIAGVGDVGQAMTDIISTFDSLSQGSRSRFDAVRRLSGFGKNDEFVNINTADLNQRKNNSLFMNGTVNGLAFASLADSAKNIEYFDVADLNDTASVVDDVYDDLIDSPTNKFSNDFIDQISEIRNQLRIFFDQERLIVNKIIQVETRPTPATVLAYAYYGNTDEYDEILSLNKITNPAVISGTIKILEQ